MNQRKVFFFDFDNTLFSHKTHRVPQSAKAALGNLRADGHIVVLASGRGLESRTMIDMETGFIFDAYIMLNGQIVTEGDELVFERYIEIEASQSLFSLADSLGVAYGGFCSRGQAVNCINDNVRSVWTDYKALVPQVIPDFRYLEKIYLLQLYIAQDQEEIFSRFTKDYVTNRPHVCMMNLIPSNAGKSLGISFLLKRYGFKRSDSFAFGDAFNDIDMLQAAGFSIAMEDGDPKLAEIATLISPPADQDGISRTLSKLGLIHLVK